MEKEDWIYLGFIGAVVVLMGFAFWARYRATAEEDKSDSEQEQESRELHKRRFEL